MAVYVNLHGVGIAIGERSVQSAGIPQSWVALTKSGAAHFIIQPQDRLAEFSSRVAHISSDLSLSLTVTV